MTRICIIAHNAYASLSGGDGHVGGVERQTALLAKYLAANGHHVSIIVWGRRPDGPTEICGVHILYLCSQNAGVPGIRFLVPRWSSLWRAMLKADADIYYQNGAESTTGQAAMFCRLHKRKFVFSSASDTDCEKELPALPSLREKVLYRYGLKNASRIIVQTESQKRSLREHFGQKSQVLPMPCNYEVTSRPEYRKRNVKVIWVGRLVQSKRLEWLFEIASMRPEYEYHIAGAIDEDVEYGENQIRRAADSSNVKYHGQLNQDELAKLYSKALVLLCTSEIEGFPNTFLESWAHGIPVVTTFDPDNVVRDQGLGESVESVRQAVEAIDRLADSSGSYLSISDRCREYFAEVHATPGALERFEKALLSA